MKVIWLFFLLLVGCSYEDHREQIVKEAIAESNKIITILDSIFAEDSSFRTVGSTFLQDHKIKTEIKSSYVKTKLKLHNRESDYSIEFSTGIFGPYKVYSSFNKAWTFEE